jgi:MFS family permease
MANPTSRAKGLLFFALFNSIVGFSILFPILAPLSRSLGLSEVEVGWLATSYSLMQFLGSPYFGRLSERVGRKPVLLLGVFGFAISFGTFGLIARMGEAGRLEHSMLLGLLISARVLGGFLSSATFPAAQAYIADLTDSDERVSGMALVGAAFGLGMIFGPVIGALLTRFGLLVPIWTSMVLALLNGCFIALRLPATSRKLGPVQPHADGVLRRTLPILSMMFVTVLASVAMEQTIAFLYQDTLQLDARSTAWQVGLAMGIYGVSAVLAQGYVVRRMKWSPTSLMRVGILIGIVGFAGLVVAQNYALLSVAMAVQGFGYGLAMPGMSALLSVSVDDREQGEVAGLGSSTQALGRTIGPLMGASLYRLNPRYPYVFALLMLVAVMFTLLLGSHWRRLSGATTNAE